MNQDLLFCVNDRDEPVENVARRLCHRNPQLTHRVVHVMVQSENGDILSQLRARTKDIQPGKWDMAVGGHVDPGETYEQAAVREYSEELGRHPGDLTPIYDYTWLSEYESEKVRTFLTYDSGPFPYDRIEIEDLAFLSAERIEELKSQEKLTGNFCYEMKRFQGMQANRERMIGHYPVQAIGGCRTCERMLDLRRAIQEKSNLKAQSYWNNPVLGFGDLGAEILIVGLAPSADGANRTGRPFTGDASGRLLASVLFGCGMANRPDSTARLDGLQLNNIFLTNAVKCVPPVNKPNSFEINACRSLLLSEMRSLFNLKVVLAFGTVAFQSIQRIFSDLISETKILKEPFRSENIYKWQADLPTIIGCFHPSPRNVARGLVSSVPGSS